MGWNREDVRRGMKINQSEGYSRVASERFKGLVWGGCSRLALEKGD